MIRLEFPAQGYVNPLNTTLEFDVQLESYGTPAAEIVRFQNNIQSLFSRVRLLYGATPLEDIINYNVIVRALTEWTGTNQTNTMDQTSINEGIGGFISSINPSVSGSPTVFTNVNVRQNFIQGIGHVAPTPPTPPAPWNPVIVNSIGDVPNQQKSVRGNAQSTRYCTRRYQVNFNLGLFTQDKLVKLILTFIDSNKIYGFTISY